MKNVFYILSVSILTICCDASWGQPLLLNYQGVARSTTGAPLADQNISLQLSIIDGSPGGTTQYKETQNTTTNAYGLFVVKIGAGTVVSGTMSAVTWSAANKYLDVQMDPTGGSSYTDLGTTELVSVPYALSTPWSGLSNVPAQNSHRTIYIPAGSFGRDNGSTNIYPYKWGLDWANSSETAGFVLPKPSDWDSTTAFTITLYFAIPLASAGASYNWRLEAGANKTNLSTGGTGWDSFDYWATQDAGVTSYPSSGTYTDLCKSQTWTSSFSTTYNTWYFGSGVTTADDFINNTMWHFTFERGNAVSNGETYSGTMVVSGAQIDYTAVH